MTAARVLVTGGAGYVGSVVVEELLAWGAERVMVLDDLSEGHADAVVAPAVLVRGKIEDGALVERVCREERIDAVVHMAASSRVGESVADPAKYYARNVVGSLSLLGAMRAAGVNRFVLSSTAAVYGEPAATPIREDFPLAPTNPYGETKLAVERALGWFRAAYGLDFVALRYFNAAGATERNGEQHSPETHLIPLVLDVAAGIAAEVTVFGHGHPTPDGTCIRDYVHVRDLARAHVLALEKLERAPQGCSGKSLNLGSGAGYSVREVIETARRVTGRPIAVREGPARKGDPPSLVASFEGAAEVLGWRPVAALAPIIEDAWRWKTAHPNGYGAR